MRDPRDRIKCIYACGEDKSDEVNNSIVIR
jgi:hypothetical protein